MKEANGYTIINVARPYDKHDAFRADIVHNNGTVIKNRYGLPWSVLNKTIVLSEQEYDEVAEDESDDTPIETTIETTTKTEEFYLLIK